LITYLNICYLCLIDVGHGHVRAETNDKFYAFKQF